MPKLPAARDALMAQIDSLAPREALTSLVARQPAIDHTADSPIALDAPSKRALLQKRVQVEQVPGIIPTYYNYNGPAAGTVVGIVFGSVAGFLLVVWLFYSIASINAPGGGAHIAGEEEIVVRRRRNSHSGRSRRSTRTEVREYSRSPRRREQIIVEERRQPARTRSVVVEERVRVPGDDVVEVIEEHDDYRSRRGSRRSSSGYRY